MFWQSNNYCLPVPFQSSSIYSHIDSDSTVNELSQFHLDRFNSTLSPTTPSDYSGIGKNILNSLQTNNNNNINNRKEISRDSSQLTSLSYAANSIYPFLIKPDDLVSLPLIGHQGKQLYAITYQWDYNLWMTFEWR